MKKFYRLLIREFKHIFSNGVLVSIFFGAPLLYGLTFGFVYQKGKLTEMSIVVVDEDNTPLSAKIIDALNDNENLKIADVRYNATGIAEEMAAKEFIAIVTIPHAFEADILQKRYPEIQVDLNMANLVPANFASRGLQAVLGTLNAGTEIEGLKKAGTDASSATRRFEAFKVNYNRLYNPSSNYMELMLPGILGTIMQQVLLLGLALVFARNFEDGYFTKLARASKHALFHITLKATPFIILSAVMWVVVCSFYPLFGIDMPVFSFPMFCLISLFTLACMFIGMLFSVAIPNQLKATEFLMVIATPSFLLSGYTWPREAMPSLIAKIADMIPLTHFMEGFRKLAIYRGTMNDAAPQFTALAIISGINFGLMLILLQWKIIRERKKQTAITHGTVKHAIAK